MIDEIDAALKRRLQGDPPPQTPAPNTPEEEKGSKNHKS